MQANHDVVLYVNDVLDKVARGWLSINIEDFGKSEICYSTKVSAVDFPKRTELTILEGVHKNQKANLDNDNMWPGLSRFFNIEGCAKLILNRDTSILRIEGFSPIDVIVDKGGINKGKYYLHLPSFQHHKKTPYIYLNETIGGSRFAETWFEFSPVLGRGHGQFMHFGRFSSGCITVPYRKESSGIIWTNIFLMLLRARLNETIIGELEVV